MVQPDTSQECTHTTAHLILIIRLVQTFILITRSLRSYADNQQLPTNAMMIEMRLSHWIYQNFLSWDLIINIHHLHLMHKYFSVGLFIVHLVPFMIQPSRRKLCISSLLTLCPAGVPVPYFLLTRADIALRAVSLPH